MKEKTFVTGIFILNQVKEKIEQQNIKAYITFNHRIYSDICTLKTSAS
jgi:hypothetical protein